MGGENSGLDYDAPKGDMLREIFRKQADLQLALNTDTTSQQFRTVMTLAAVVELSEFIQETPWKPWKKQQQLDEEKAKEELVDVLHFFVNLCLSLGLYPQELYERYMEKNAVNFQRKLEGY